MARIKHPFGAATVLTPAYVATIAIDVWNTKTELDLGTITGDATLNITPDAELEIGSELNIKVKASADGYDVTLGSSIEAPVIVGVSGKTKTQKFEFDGTNFRPVGAIVQND